MNTETGEVITQKQIEKLAPILQSKYVPIKEQLMTKKQRLQKQVSKFDNRSPLGKLRIEAKGRLRNQPCPCGSGLKFKKCCWDKDRQDNQLI